MPMQSSAVVTTETVDASVARFKGSNMISGFICDASPCALRMADSARCVESSKGFFFRASLDAAILSKADTTKTMLLRVDRADDLVAVVDVESVR